MKMNEHYTGGLVNHMTK